MADPKKTFYLQRFLVRVFVWVAFITSIWYVMLFEPEYQAHAVCDEATWNRVVADPPLSGVRNPIVIGSNAGFLFVVSASRCINKTSTPESKDRSWMSIVSGLFEYVNDRWNYLWSNDETELPSAVVVPSSRVLCVYEVDAGGKRSPVPCEVRPEDPVNGGGEDGTPADLENHRVRWEIRDKLKTENLSCIEDWKISKPFVFRPGESEEPVVTTDDETVADFIEGLRLQDGYKATIHVFGLASADGDYRYNRQLSKKRADAVREQIKTLVRQRANEPIDIGNSFPLGEDHLASGVAESRSVRVVACVSSD